DDGFNCPYSTAGSGGDPTSCDYTFDGTNGCTSHGMANYFGGHPLTAQPVFIKDNSSGFIGFQRDRITSVSILSDTVFGAPLAEIWCNDGGNAANAFVTNATVVDYRDESDFADTLSIVGAGP